MTSVYLSGPMLNWMNHNVEAFKDWTAKLREAGYVVESPHEYDRDHGFDPRGTGFVEDEIVRRFDMRAAMAYSVNWICTQADAVAVLDKWERSEGATAQVHIAWRVRIPVFSVHNLLLWGLEAPQTYPKAW